jgi:hypothetical protein
MRSHKTGLGLIRELGWLNPTQSRHGTFDGAATNTASAKRELIERPRISAWRVVFAILIALIYSYYVTVTLRNQAKGRVIFVPDYGAPPPCLPPSKGLWSGLPPTRSPKAPLKGGRRQLSGHDSNARLEGPAHTVRRGGETGFPVADTEHPGSHAPRVVAERGQGQAPALPGRNYSAQDVSPGCIKGTKETKSPERGGTRTLIPSGVESHPSQRTRRVGHPAKAPGRTATRPKPQSPIEK